LRVVNSPPQAQPEASTREVLASIVERVTFHNAENGFCVLRIKARGHRELITVISHAAVIAAGEWVTASGEWVNDRTHGQQFKSRFMRTSAPTTTEGIEKMDAAQLFHGDPARNPGSGKDRRLFRCGGSHPRNLATERSRSQSSLASCSAGTPSITR
jgi:hypothetical protein